MSDGSVKILDGNTFVVSDTRGDIEASLTDPTGLFSFDTRFLSKWVLTINGDRMNPLSVDDLEYFESRFFLVPGTGTVYVDAKLSVIRRRAVGNGFHEELTILNHADEPVDLRVRLDAGCDFADLFEVKDALQKKGAYSARAKGGKLVLAYVRGTFGRSTVISSSQPARARQERPQLQDPHRAARQVEHAARRRHGGARVRGDAGASRIRREPGGRHAAEPGALDRAGTSPRMRPGAAEGDLPPQPRRPCSASLLAAIAGRTQPPGGGPPLVHDHVRAGQHPHEPAGAAVHLRAGRDDPPRARRLAGPLCDDFRDEDPGRILHEMRYGELTAFEERPHSPYYGSADATPLFVVLLDEYERWTGDRALVRELEVEARAALNWIDEYADLQGNGYLSYERRNKKTGLENQCWKDSWDSISFRDGRLPGLPARHLRAAGLCVRRQTPRCPPGPRDLEGRRPGGQLEQEAAELKRRFNRDFWVEDGEYFALALDPEGRQVDALTSNNGHLLWSGIVDKSKAKAVAAAPARAAALLRLGRPHAGRGRRPLQPDRLPRRHGLALRQLLHRLGPAAVRVQGRGRGSIAAGILDAAEFFEGRLPEAFGGYERSQTRYPVQYPTACSPQAWSTGAPLLLLRTMLGLEPQGEHLVVDPALPSAIGHLELLDIPGRWGRIDAFGRGRVNVEDKGRRA